MLPFRPYAPLFVLGVVAVLAAAIGVYLLRIADATPPFTDSKRAELLDSRGPDEADPHDRKWHRELDALRTNKWKVHDRGLGFIFLSVCLLASIPILGLHKPNALASLQTPFRRRFVVLCVLTYLSFVPAFWLYLYDGLSRGYYPPWADAIAIPAAGVAFFALLGLPVAAVFLWFCVWRANMPVSIWAWNAERPLTSQAVTAFFVLVAFACLVLIVHTVWRDTPYLIPPLFCSAYLALCARAALLSPRISRVKVPADG